MALGPLGDRTAPTAIDGRGEEPEPTGEELGAKRLSFVDQLMGRENEAVVAGMAKEHPTPVVDELRNVDRPVNLGDLGEHRAQEIIERDLTVEADNEVVDARPGVEIRSLGHRATTEGGSSRSWRNLASAPSPRDT